MISEEVKEICYEIGQFFLQKNNGDLCLTAREVTNLGISLVEIVDGEVRITLNRVGLLLGRRGEQIGKLIDFLGKDIRVIEQYDNFNNYLIPYDYSLSDWWHEDGR